MKKVLTAAIFVLYALTGNAATFEIDGDCVYLNELFGEEYPSFPVQCGFQPGDRRLLPPNVINSALKRAGLPDAADSFYTICRAGYKLSEEVIRQELTALYVNKYPEKEIRVESVRTGRDVYIAPGMAHRLEVDLDRLGSVQGYIRTGSVRNSFSYVVKAFEDGYIISEKVRHGDNLAEKTIKAFIDITNLRGELVKEPNGLVATKAFPKGRALTTDMVEMRPDRVKGDAVLIVYSRGNVKLEVPGIAEGNAVIGKNFLVRNPASGVVLSAVYEGNGKAVVN